MNSRKVGEWFISWGMVDDYEEGWGEDGRYTRRVQTLLVQAARSYGDMYTCGRLFASEDEASVYCRALPEDFDPRTHSDWGFWRNSYGSDAYQDNWHEEEYDRMSPEEQRYHHGR